MKIYFSGSISGGREDALLYAGLVGILRDAGHDVIAGEVADLGAAVEAGTDEEIHDRDLGWIDEVAEAKGLVVAEISRPSLGVGYEIAYALHVRHIPVIALYRPEWTRRCSAMITGHPDVRVIRYEESDRGTLGQRLLTELGLVNKTGETPVQS